LTPSKAALLEATLFKSPAGTAGAQIIAAQLFFQQLVAMHDPRTPLDLVFGRKTFAAFAHRFKKTVFRQIRRISSDTSRGAENRVVCESRHDRRKKVR